MTNKMPVTDTTHASLRLWLRLLSCTKLIQDEIRGNLRDSFNTTLPRFDVMAQLYRYPEGLRMGEISQLLMVTNGNVTGIIDQLEKEKLVERCADPSDRRVWRVQLTPTGSTVFAEMAAQHENWIIDLIGGLSDTEQQALQTLLFKLKESIHERETAT